MSASVSEIKGCTWYLDSLPVQEVKDALAKIFKDSEPGSFVVLQHANSSLSCCFYYLFWNGNLCRIKMRQSLSEDAWQKRVKSIFKIALEIELKALVETDPLTREDSIIQHRKKVLKRQLHEFSCFRRVT